MKKKTTILFLTTLLIANLDAQTFIYASTLNDSEIKNNESQIIDTTNNPLIGPNFLNMDKFSNEIEADDLAFLQSLSANLYNDLTLEIVIPENENYNVYLEKNKDIDGSAIQIEIPVDSEFVDINLTIENFSTNMVYNITLKIGITREPISVNTFEAFEFTIFNENEEIEEIEEKEENEEIEESVEKNENEPAGDLNTSSDPKVDEVKEKNDNNLEEQNQKEETSLDQAAVVAKKRTIEENKSVMMSRSSIYISNGIYTVAKGDTFNSIAKKFNLSTLQLQAYNPNIGNINYIAVGKELAVTREGVEKMLSNEEKKYLYTGNGSGAFTSPQEFFDNMFPHARELANLAGEERLYVSIMLAQAALESGYGNSALSSPPYNNLTGIKRKGNEAYVKMWTREETSKKESYYILADFKVFPSYYDALKGNADLIRYSSYYKNIWVKHSPTYKDAVKALNDSPYATDNAYGEKILSIINRYKLYEYDFDTILSSKTVNYNATIKHSNSGIYTLPKMVKSSILYTSYLHNGENVKVVEEATTESGTYVKLSSLKTGKVLGWIKKSDLNLYNTIQKTNPVNYNGQIKTNNDGIYTNPKGTFGAILYTSYRHNGQEFKVTEEAITDSGTYVKLVNSNNKVIGWINKNSLNVFSSKKVSYYATVKSNNTGIYTNPKGMSNSVLYTSYLYNWKSVKVTDEMTTSAGTYAKIQDGFNKTIGWIKKSELSIVNSTKVNYYSQIKSRNKGIFTAPQVVTNSKLYTSYLHNWKNVNVVEEVVFNGEIYANIVLMSNGKNIGWIKKSDLLGYTRILSEKTVNYTATVKPKNSGIYTLPKGSYGAKLYTSYLYNWKSVKVISEATTQNGTFVRIADANSGKAIGWISKADISY